MNHGKARNAGSHRGSRGRSPASGQWIVRQKSEIPVTVDRHLDESSGNRGRGSQGRRRCVYDNDEHNPVKAYVNKKSSQVSHVGFLEKGVQQDTKSQEDGPDEGDAVKFSGDNKDLLQSSALSSKNNVNLSGGSFLSRECEDKDINLVNQRKDVALCGQEYVSFASAQSVELSSVMYHDNAHKSGDAGNPSNEINMRSFDLFVKKNAVELKPSIRDLNREKKKATKGFYGIVIRPGMVLLKNYLSIDDQVMILNKCRQLGLGEGGFYQPGYQNGALLHLKMMCLGKNWDPETSRYGGTRSVDDSTPPKIPVVFSQLVEKAIKESQLLVATNSNKRVEEDEIPYMLPDICIVNFYTSTGRLGLHQDKDESEKSIRKGLPVVSFSIGDSAEFLYGDQRDDFNAEKVMLESGDVLLFGGKSRNVFHGVRSIHNNTAPKVLVQETGLRPGRLNLTFRQY